MTEVFSTHLFNEQRARYTWQPRDWSIGEKARTISGSSGT